MSTVLRTWFFIGLFFFEDSHLLCEVHSSFNLVSPQNNPTIFSCHHPHPQTFIAIVYCDASHRAHQCCDCVQMARIHQHTMLASFVIAQLSRHHINPQHTTDSLLVSLSFSNSNSSPTVVRRRALVLYSSGVGIRRVSVGGACINTYSFPHHGNPKTIRTERRHLADPGPLCVLCLPQRHLPRR